MLTWSDSFATHIEQVDQQHKLLFELLNKLSTSFSEGEPGEAVIDDALQELFAYADKHFVDEELLMAQHKLDPRHVNIHRMEHKSFIYDAQTIKAHLFTEDDFAEASERLVRFVTSWLTFHILGIDQVMAAQIRAIQHGATPAQAYDAKPKASYDFTTTHLMLDTVLDLWHISLERCHKLEEKLAALGNG